MCSRTEATLRLIAAWLDRAVDDLDFPCRVTLADMLTEDNIAIVSEMDLLTEYATRSAKRRLPRSTRKQCGTKQCCALGLHQNRRVQCRSDRHPSYAGGVAAYRRDCSHRLGNNSASPCAGCSGQMIDTFAESAKN